MSDPVRIGLLGRGTVGGAFHELVAERADAIAAAAGRRPEIAGPLTTENQTEHETDTERGKDCLRRVLADVLLAVVLKTAYAMECVIPYFFPALPIFIGHCACG